VNDELTLVTPKEDLMDASTLKEMGKMMLAVPIFGAPAVLLAACGSPEPKQNACDAPVRPPEDLIIGEASYSALNWLWQGNPSAAKFENWSLGAKLKLGAAKELYRPACDGGEKVVRGDVRDYLGASRSFFETHYQKKADDSENGILVLIAGLAPQSHSESTVFGGLDALGAISSAEPKTVTETKNFISVLRAGYWFNKAAEVALPETRFTAPVAAKELTAHEKSAERKRMVAGLTELKREAQRGRRKAVPYAYVDARDVLGSSWSTVGSIYAAIDPQSMSRGVQQHEEARRQGARDALAKTDELLNKVDVEALSERQREFVVELRRAAGSLSASLAKTVR
jgi:hypothetical protein